MQCSLWVLRDTVASSHKDKMHIMLWGCKSVQIFTGAVTKMDGSIRIWDTGNINISKMLSFLFCPQWFHARDLFYFIAFVYISFNCVPKDDLLVFIGILSCKCICSYYGSRQYVIEIGHFLQVIDAPYQFLFVPQFYTNTHTHINTLYHIININSRFRLPGSQPQ